MIRASIGRMGPTLCCLALVAAASSTPRDSAALQTVFPFDTTVCCTCQGSMPGRADLSVIPIARYADTLVYQNPSLAAVSEDTSYGDFALDRLPLFSTEPLLVKRILHHFALSCTVQVTPTEYLFRIDSLWLYMSVSGGTLDAVEVRFDTARSVPAWSSEFFPAELTIGLQHGFYGIGELAVGFMMPDTSAACPRVVTGDVLATGLGYEPKNEIAAPWPPDTSLYGRVITGTRVPEVGPPLVTRYVGSDCQDSATVFQVDSAEYTFRIAGELDLFLTFAQHGDDSIVFLFDTLTSSAAGIGPTPPRGIRAPTNSSPKCVPVVVLRVNEVWGPVRAYDLLGRTVSPRLDPSRALRAATVPAVYLRTVSPGVDGE